MVTAAQMVHRAVLVAYKCGVNVWLRQVSPSFAVSVSILPVYAIIRLSRPSGYWAYLVCILPLPYPFLLVAISIAPSSAVVNLTGFHLAFNPSPVVFVPISDFQRFQFFIF